LADNVGYTPGTGVNIAADGSVADGALRQRVKIQTGTEGQAADVASGQALPVYDDSLLLRRLAKLLETLAVVDQQTRQRITVDNITTGLTLGTVTTVGTVSNITAGTVNLGTGCGLQSTVATNTTLASSTYSATTTMNYCDSMICYFTGTGASSGTVSIYGSSDNTTFFQLPTAYQIAVSTTPVTTVLNIPACRYVKIQSTVALSAYSLQFQGTY
jgi:hypothetical protein